MPAARTEYVVATMHIEPRLELVHAYGTVSSFNGCFYFCGGAAHLAWGFRCIEFVLTIFLFDGQIHGLADALVVCGCWQRLSRPKIIWNGINEFVGRC